MSTAVPALARPALSAAAASAGREQKARATARDFESQFLKSMLEQAFATLSGEGPMGGAGPGAEAWRSLLLDEHAKAMSARGSIGVADQVYRALMKTSGEKSDARH